MEFKDVLKNLREKRHISQAKLASDLNLSAGTIGMYETGKRKPSSEMLETLADYFNVDIDYLLGRETVSTYLLNPEAAFMIRELQERPELKVLLETSRDATKEDIEAVIRLLQRK